MIPRLLGYGSAVVDILATVDDAFLRTIPGDKGGTVLITPETMRDILSRLPVPPARLPGGAAPNTLVGYARLLDGHAGLLAIIGDDDNGRLFRQHLADAQVDDSRCRIAPQGATGAVLALITPDAERTMRTNLGVNADITPDTFTTDDFSGYSHFLLEGYTFRMPGIGEALARTAARAGLSLCLDFNAQEVASQYRGTLDTILRQHVDIVFANEHEAAAFCETDDEHLALERLAERCELAIVKLGARGCLLKHHGEPPIHVPACTVPHTVDTTGAGDSFAAGFLAAWLNGHTLRDAAECGAHVAAEIVQVMGAQLPPETWTKLKQTLKR